MGQEKNVTIAVNEAEHKIIQSLRELGYGQIVVTVKDYKAIHIEERKSIPIKDN